MDQDENISAIEPDDPMLYWIFRDEDFIPWKSEDHPQVLLLWGGPPGSRMTDVSSHIANKDAKGTVFYYSCRTMRTTFALSVLRHILTVSDDCCINRSQPLYRLTGLALIRADSAQPSLYIDDEYIHICTVYIWPYGLIDRTIKLL